MALLATRLMITAAVALVAAAQAVVSPASCCLLREALFGGEACCHAKAEPAPRSCCHGAAKKIAGPSVAEDRHSPRGDECLWCSAGPKVVSGDRVPAPDHGGAGLPLSVAAVEPPAAAPASSRLVVKEPFHRTALAACAWLCVWRK